MIHLPVKSSMLATLGYNPETETLVARFASGEQQVYRYDGVPPDVFVGVITNTDSHGRAFNELVKKSFEGRKLDTEQIAAL